jgi:kinesin family protein 15
MLQQGKGSVPPVDDGENPSVTVSVRIRPIVPRDTTSLQATNGGMYNRSKSHDTHNVARSEVVRIAHDTLRVCTKQQTQHIAFDRVLDGSATQQQVFNCLGRPLVDQVMGGTNACLVAYGQTGAGKTFSMLGRDTQATPSKSHKSQSSSASPGHNEAQGLIPRAIEYLFRSLETRASEFGPTQTNEYSYHDREDSSARAGFNYMVEMSYLQVRSMDRQAYYYTYANG